MNKKIRYMAVALVLALMCCASPLNLSVAYADELVAMEENIVFKEAYNIQADVIVRYYRMHNGHLQYRRYNETRGYWVDSHWINCNTGNSNVEDI